MRKIPVHSPADEAKHQQPVDYIVVEEVPETRINAVLSDGPKHLIVSALYRGLEVNYLLPVTHVEKFNQDQQYYGVRFIADKPKMETPIMFTKIGLVVPIGGIKRLVWYERCVLTNRLTDIFMEVNLFMKLEL